MHLLLYLTTRQDISAVRRLLRDGLFDGWLTRPEYLRCLASLEEVEADLPPNGRVWSIRKALEREG